MTERDPTPSSTMWRSGGAVPGVARISFRSLAEGLLDVRIENVCAGNLLRRMAGIESPCPDFSLCAARHATHATCNACDMQRM